MMNLEDNKRVLTKGQSICVLFVPLLVGVICTVTAILLNPSDEATGRLWVVMPPLSLTIVARAFIHSHTTRFRQGAHLLYWGVALYFVVLLAIVGLAELLGSHS